LIDRIAHIRDSWVLHLSWFRLRLWYLPQHKSGGMGLGHLDHLLSHLVPDHTI